MLVRQIQFDQSFENQMQNFNEVFRELRNDVNDSWKKIGRYRQFNYDVVLAEKRQREIGS